MLEDSTVIPDCSTAVTHLEGKQSNIVYCFNTYSERWGVLIEHLTMIHNCLFLAIHCKYFFKNNNMLMFLFKVYLTQLL